MNLRHLPGHASEPALDDSAQQERAVDLNDYPVPALSESRAARRALVLLAEQLDREGLPENAAFVREQTDGMFSKAGELLDVDDEWAQVLERRAQQNREHGDR